MRASICDLNREGLFSLQIKKQKTIKTMEKITAKTVNACLDQLSLIVLIVVCGGHILFATVLFTALIYIEVNTEGFNWMLAIFSLTLLCILGLLLILLRKVVYKFMIILIYIFKNNMDYSLEKNVEELIGKEKKREEVSYI
ncbi:MAG: hypothetical protein QY321_02025 [Patescibacteria group bacterium]|nr:MAG: hypothetical protein QY321_02025 [Patescibacteria group bacterium]